MRTRITKSPEYFIEPLDDGRWAVTDRKGKIRAYEINRDLAKKTAIRLAELSFNYYMFVSAPRSEDRRAFTELKRSQLEALPRKKKTGL